MMPVVAKINTVVTKVKNINYNEKSDELKLQPNVYATFILGQNIVKSKNEAGCNKFRRKMLHPLTSEARGWEKCCMDPRARNDSLLLIVFLTMKACFDLLSVPSLIIEIASNTS